MAKFENINLGGGQACFMDSGREVYLQDVCEIDQHEPVLGSLLSAGDIEANSNYECALPSFGEFVLDSEGICPNRGCRYGFRDAHSDCNALNLA